MTRTRRLATALALAAVLALAVFHVAQAAPVPATANSQHFVTTVHTDFFGNVSLNLQLPVTAQGDVVIKILPYGPNHTGGENPSIATVNFNGFVNASDRDSINARVIGWHANTVTGRAEFAYYSNKDADIAVDVYPRTAAPPPAP